MFRHPTENGRTAVSVIDNPRAPRCHQLRTACSIEAGESEAPQQVAVPHTPNSSPASAEPASTSRAVLEKPSQHSATERGRIHTGSPPLAYAREGLILQLGSGERNLYYQINSSNMWYSACSGATQELLELRSP